MDLEKAFDSVPREVIRRAVVRIVHDNSDNYGCHASSIKPIVCDCDGGYTISREFRDALLWDWGCYMRMIWLLKIKKLLPVYLVLYKPQF